MSGEHNVDDKIFDEQVHEVLVLERLGYRQELKRSFSLLGMIGFSFNIVTCWTALGGVLIIGVQSGGANFVLGQANLVYPEYIIERWHTVLLAYLIVLLCTVGNVYGPHLLDKVSRVVLIWNIVSFVTVIVVVLATNDHKQPASFVFRDFQNFTGFGTAFTAILGLLQSAFGMCCYDAPSHMTEEMLHASREAPKAIVMTVYIGAITGLVFLVSICFCIGDITTTAQSSTGVPLIQIFYDSTQSVVGACFLSSLVTVILLFSANLLITEGSRCLYAFARDHGLPFSRHFAKVEPRRQVPVNAILLTCAVQMALNAIYFGTLTGFNTVISIATEGFYLSYAMPLLARVLARFTGHTQVLSGPYALGKYSIVLNAIGLVFLLFTSITFNFPTVNPVDQYNMNYTSAAVAIIGLVSAVTWITTGRKNFTGPETGITITSVEVTKGVDGEGSSGEGGEYIWTFASGGKTLAGPGLSISINYIDACCTPMKMLPGMCTTHICSEEDGRI
ncbi:MAG: hypothetical protein Q9187_001859 [Circinaria calcarea]